MEGAPSLAAAGRRLNFSDAAGSAARFADAPADATNAHVPAKEPRSTSGGMESAEGWGQLVEAHEHMLQLETKLELARSTSVERRCVRRRAWLPPHDQSEPRFSWMVGGARQRFRASNRASIYVTLLYMNVRYYVTRPQRVLYGPYTTLATWLLPCHVPCMFWFFRSKCTVRVF